MRLSSLSERPQTGWVDAGSGRRILEDEWYKKAFRRPPSSNFLSIPQSFDFLELFTNPPNQPTLAHLDSHQEAAHPTHLDPLTSPRPPRPHSSSSTTTLSTPRAASTSTRLTQVSSLAVVIMAMLLPPARLRRHHHHQALYPGQGPVLHVPYSARSMRVSYPLGAYPSWYKVKVKAERSSSRTSLTLPDVAQRIIDHSVPSLDYGASPSYSPHRGVSPRSERRLV
ncbi:hypothetical protein BDZ90DRAFT_92555 [Jaminaea rosea]|uniref:Uncharacterized protein n=1 Tax=Jaminaea rosea TaxID=1569628 RepID=A0A316UHJ3_9BASI|nr:hypothetical protein BDZ90DRAFT_92555 [Jaminaea rosea]PWN24670.1 hypothetical protein BDZ90DRAFT_92555 [Jaminaea rosea]